MICRKCRSQFELGDAEKVLPIKRGRVYCPACQNAKNAIRQQYAPAQPLEMSVICKDCNILFEAVALYRNRFKLRCPSCQKKIEDEKEQKKIFKRRIF